MIVPTTAHAAFDKASQFFNIKAIRVPVGADFRADVEATRAAITKNTVVIVGSAPPFPHGIVDPIEELSELAREHNIGFHTDACLGGFVLPWAEKLGYPVPPFDFRLPGVTSMSADTHKYGYAAKGTSVVLYRGSKLRRHQYYMIADWPGGLYLSPTLAGSRPGALSAACWAAMISIGEKGYMEATRRILETADLLKKAINDIPELYVFGDPLFNIAFSSRDTGYLCGFRPNGQARLGFERFAAPALRTSLPDSATHTAWVGRTFHRRLTRIGGMGPRAPRPSREHGTHLWHGQQYGSWWSCKGYSQGCIGHCLFC